MGLIPYMRQSRARENTISIDEQRRDIRLWAENAKVKLAPEVVEQNVSGSKPWRDRALGEAILSVERGEADGIVVAFQDRLSRENSLGTAEVWDALEKAGARLVCVNEGLDTDAGDQELQFGLKALIAREQWKTYAKRWDQTKRSAIERGVYVSGQVPVGYAKNDARRLVPDSATAPAVRKLFKARGRGASWGECASLMDELLPRDNGGAWTRQGVERIVTNRCYIGVARQGAVVNVAAHKPLVDEETWLLAQPSKGEKSAPRSGSVLSGLLVCGSCGNSLSRASSRTYGCRARRADGVCDAPVQIGNTRVEEYVLGLFCERAALRVTETKGSGSVDTRAAMRDLERARTQLTAYLESDLAGVIGAGAFRSGAIKHQAAVDEATTRVVEAGPLPLSAVLDVDSPEQVAIALESAGSIEAQRRLLGTMIERVVVKPAKVLGDRSDVSKRVTIKWRTHGRK